MIMNLQYYYMTDVSKGIESKISKDFQFDQKKVRTASCVGNYGSIFDAVGDADYISKKTIKSESIALDSESDIRSVLGLRNLGKCILVSKKNMFGYMIGSHQISVISTNRASWLLANYISYSYENTLKISNETAFGDRVDYFISENGFTTLDFGERITGISMSILPISKPNTLASNSLVYSGDDIRSVDTYEKISVSFPDWLIRRSEMTISDRMRKFEDCSNLYGMYGRLSYNKIEREKSEFREIVVTAEGGVRLGFEALKLVVHMKDAPIVEKIKASFETASGKKATLLGGLTEDSVLIDYMKGK